MLSFIQRRMAWMRVCVASCLLASSLVASGQSPSPSKESGATIRAVPGAPAPAFSLRSINGETVNLSDFHGQTVLIYFWATWCGPCKIMTPWLVDLQNKYTARGFHVLAISLDDDATRVEVGEYADQNHMNYPVLIGNEAVANSYGGVPAMPESVLIGSDGKIVERIVGLRSKGDLEQSITKALSAKAVDQGPAPAASQAQK